MDITPYNVSYIVPIVMSCALLAYSITILLGFYQKQHNISTKWHYSFGIIAMLLNGSAVYFMNSVAVGIDAPTWLLWIHITTSTSAIVLLSLILFLAFQRFFHWHKQIVLYAFVPLWLSAFVSGLYILTFL